MFKQTDQLHIAERTTYKKVQDQLGLPISNDGETITNIVTVISHIIEKHKCEELHLETNIPKIS